LKVGLQLICREAGGLDVLYGIKEHLRRPLLPPFICYGIPSLIVLIYLYLTFPKVLILRHPFPGKVLHQGTLAALVNNLKVLVYHQKLRLFLQYAHRQGVQGLHFIACRPGQTPLFQKIPDPPGKVGHRRIHHSDYEDLAGLVQAFLDQICRQVCQHRSLTRSRHRRHRKLSAPVGRHFPLSRSKIYHFHDPRSISTSKASSKIPSCSKPWLLSWLWAM